jgi:hypothetical protein
MKPKAYDLAGRVNFMRYENSNPNHDSHQLLKTEQIDDDDDLFLPPQESNRE